MLTRSTRSDAHYVRQTLAGQREAFTELVNRYLGVALAYAYARLDTYAEAEETAQEAMVRAFERLDTLRDPNKFGPWLIGIVKNCASRVHERRHREATFQAEQAAVKTAETTDFARKELLQLVRNAVERLPQVQREVVLLRYFSRKSSRAIAGLLGMSNASVRKNLERARKQLGADLLEQVGEDFRPKDDLKKKTLAIVAASEVAWQTHAASAAVGTVSGAATSIFSVTVPKVAVAGLLALTVAGWFAFKSPSDVPEPIQVASAEPVIADSESITNTDPIAEPEIEDETEESADPVEPTPAAESRSGIARYPVRGIIVDEQNNPVEDARVTLRLMPGMDWSERRVFNLGPTLHRAVTRSDDHGRFRFDRLPVAGLGGLTGEISVTTPAGAAYSRVSIPNSSRNDYDWQIHVARTETLSGKVLAADGSRIRDAVLRPIDFEHRDPSSTAYVAGHEADIQAGSDGAFVIDHLYAGRWKFLVFAPGFAPRETEFIDTGNTDVRIQLDPGISLSGRALFDDDVSSTDGLRIGLVNTQQYREYHFTDIESESGRFTFDSLRHGTYTAWIDHPDYILRPDEAVVKISATTAGATTTFTPQRGGVIEGRLVDKGTGEGIPGVRLRANRVQGTGEQVTGYHDIYRLQSIAKTSPDGSFRIVGLEPASYTLAYGGHPSLPPYRGDVHWTREPIAIDRPGSVSTLTWPIDRRLRLTGTVIDERGEPVPNAEVRVLPRGETKLAEAFLASRIEYPSDENGEFTIYFPTTGENVYLQAVMPGLVSREAGPLSIGTTNEHVTLTLEPSASISGVVLGRNGKPSARTSVTITGQRTGPLMRTITYLMGGGDVRLRLTPGFSSEGSFRVGQLPPDTYVLTTGRNTQGVTVTLGPGEHRDDIVLPLFPPAVSLLEGRVTVKGAPAPNCDVSFTRESARTDTDGNFVVSSEHLPANNVSVTVATDVRGMSTRRELRVKAASKLLQRRPLQFDLASGPSSVSGHVYRNGKPWQRATVGVSILWGDGVEERVHVETNQDGFYSIEGLPSGPNGLEVSYTYAKGLQPTIPVDLRPGENAGFDIHLQPGYLRATVQGIQSHETGIVRVVPGRHVVIEITRQSIQKIQSETIVSRPISYDQEVGMTLEEGTYTFYVAAYDESARGLDQALPSLRVQTVPVEIVAGYRTEVVVDLARGPGEVTITRVD